MATDDPLLSLLYVLTYSEFTDDEISNICELSPDVFRSYQQSLRKQKSVTSFRGLDELISFGVPKDIEIISPSQNLTLDDWQEALGFANDFDWTSIDNLT